MRTLLAGLALLALRTCAFAADPVDAFKQKFGDQEQILLAGVLTDPAQAAEFASDAQSGGDAAKAKWYARISEFSSGYLARPHGYNDKGADVKSVAEPAEWNMVMVTLRKMRDGGLIQQGKMKIFIGMIDDANDDIKRGDYSSAHKVIDMGRKNLMDALNEYLASPNGRTGAATAAQLRQEEAARKALEKRRQEQANQPPAVPADPAKTPVPPKKPVQTGVEPDPRHGPSVNGDDEAARQAREQAEKIRSDLANGGDGSKGYENGRTANGPTPVSAGANGGSSTTLAPAAQQGKPTLAVKEPPAPGDDMAELHQLKEQVKGHKTLYATIGGAVLGGLAFGLIFGLLFGPIGAIIGAVAGAAAGGLGGRMVGMKLWG